MRDVFVDVELELEVSEVGRKGKHAVSRYLLERSRDAADKLCSESGARLRTDRKPEVIIRRGEHKLTGRDAFLVASRWAAVAPEGVLTPN